MTTYEQLLAQVGDVICLYRTDLTVHDKASIENNPGVPFLHWTTDRSTQMVFLWPADSDKFPKEDEMVPYLFGVRDRWGLARVPVEIAEYFAKTGEPIRTHYFDGIKLHQTTPSLALDLARKHHNRLNAQWSAQMRRFDYANH